MTTKKLHVSDELSLPLGIANKTICIFGKGGSGKSNLEVVLAEELYAAGIPTCIVDPADVHYGIKSARDGKSEGLPFVIFGGLHADVPIYPENGVLLADLFLDRGLYMVIVTQPWTGGERARFMTDFANQLYKRGPEKEQRGSARVLLLEEAHEYVPLSPGKDETVMLGAMKRLYTVGRNYWIGFIAATRRPARMHTDLRNGADATAFFQIVGTQDRKAMTDYLGEMADKDVYDEIVSHAAKLPVGTAYFYQPHEKPALQRVHFRYRDTLDTTTTEITAGRKTVKPVLAAVDLSKLGEAMEAAREKAKAEDPKELWRQIRENQKLIDQLQAQIKKLESAAPAPAEIKIETVEKLIVPDTQIADLDKLIGQIVPAEDLAHSLATTLGNAAQAVQQALANARTINQGPRHDITDPRPVARHTVSTPRAAAPRLSQKKRERSPIVLDGDFKITGTQQRVLDALAWYASIGITEPSNVQVGAVALIDHTGGYFGDVVRPLAAAGLVVQGRGSLALTEAGAAQSAEPLNISTLEDYHAVLRDRVRQAKNASGKTIEALDAIIERNGDELSNAEIGGAIKVDHTGGYFGDVIRPLVKVGLITRERGAVRPTKILFPPGL